jgi:ABC-type oligopeptide transport system substrate-binding subunit
MAKCEEEFKLADLDKDGVPAGEDEDDIWNKGFYMQIAYNTGNDTRRLTSEILKAGIEAVNPKFNIAVVGMPWPVMLNSRTSGKLPVYVGGWLEDFHDPHNWVQPFLYSQGTYGRVINMTPEIAAEFDALIVQGATLADPEERRPSTKKSSQGSGRGRRDLAVSANRTLATCRSGSRLLLQTPPTPRQSTPGLRAVQGNALVD